MLQSTDRPVLVVIRYLYTYALEDDSVIKRGMSLTPFLWLCLHADVGGGDSCLLLFLLCLVTVVISLGGTALYCALGDAHSSVCRDFSRNADFYMGQIQRGISHIQHWFSAGS